MSAPLTDEQALAVMVSVADELKQKAAAVKQALGLSYNQWAKLRAAHLAFIDAQDRLKVAEAAAGGDFATVTARREASQAELAKLQSNYAGQLQACRDWKAGIKRAQANAKSDADKLFGAT